MSATADARAAGLSVPSSLVGRLFLSGPVAESSAVAGSQADVVDYGRCFSFSACLLVLVVAWLWLLLRFSVLFNTSPSRSILSFRSDYI